MRRSLNALMEGYLTQHDALRPASLGGRPSPPAMDPAAQSAFMQDVRDCLRTTYKVAVALTALHLILLVVLLGILIFASTRGSDTVLTTVLGGSIVAGLGIVPVRLQALWKEHTTMRLMLATLPGRPAQDQLDLVKSFYVAGKSSPGAQ